MNQRTFSKLAKAVYAAVMTCLGQLAAILVGHATFADISDGQWVTIALFTLGAAGGAFGLAGWSGAGVPGVAAEPPQPAK